MKLTPKNHILVQSVSISERTEQRALKYFSPQQIQTRITELLVQQHHQSIEEMEQRDIVLEYGKQPKLVSGQSPYTNTYVLPLYVSLANYTDAEIGEVVSPRAFQVLPSIDQPVVELSNESSTMSFEAHFDLSLLRLFPLNEEQAIKYLVRIK